ncbi:MAG TPA: hypothetical protein PKZ84_05245 [Anaerolineae bacterium]|nr:hypothetical protein [Anaerolineae bacterium]HQI83743.1 hypothetical protein [Anaerolineae bacterium]
MSTVQVTLPSQEWRELVGLSQQEQIPTVQLLQQAVRNFLDAKKRVARSRQGFQKSFGLWADRNDLDKESIVIVNELRCEWNEREQREAF